MPCLCSGNSLPVIDGPSLIQVWMGEEFTFNVTVTDADGDTVTLNYTGLPEKATFVMNADKDGGTFTWTPDSTDEIVHMTWVALGVGAGTELRLHRLLYEPFTWIFTHVKLCLATATHNFKWLKM